jgi:hypothetical protein
MIPLFMTIEERSNLMTIIKLCQELMSPNRQIDFPESTHEVEVILNERSELYAKIALDNYSHLHVFIGQVKGKIPSRELDNGPTVLNVDGSIWKGVTQFLYQVTDYADRFIIVASPLKLKLDAYLLQFNELNGKMKTEVGIGLSADTYPLSSHAWNIAYNLAEMIHKLRMPVYEFILRESGIHERVLSSFISLTEGEDDQ